MRGRGATLFVVAALVGACSSSPPASSKAPRRADSIAVAESPPCRTGAFRACDCRAGKGFQKCDGGSFGNCICHLGSDERIDVIHRDVRPPRLGDLRKYVRDLRGTGALRATFETSMGRIDCRLYENEAPLAVANFVGLARGLKAWRHPTTEDTMYSPLYNAVLFHRVIPHFMIQSGDPQGNGRGGPGYKFKIESTEDLRFDQPGVLAMANAGPDTNGSQFFITEVAVAHLNDKYTIFGQCRDLPTVKAIARVAKASGNRQLPREPVILHRVTIYRDAR